MEIAVSGEEENLKNEEFTLASITELPASSSPSASSSSSPVIGRFRLNNGLAELRFDGESEPNLLSQFNLHNTQVSFFVFC